MPQLFAGLDGMRSLLDPAAWKEFCRTFRTASGLDVVLESPFARRALEKPRGYAGDAVLIDHIYESAPCADGHLSRSGRQVYEWEFDLSGFRSVRERRRLVAAVIDEVANVRRPRVLSVACGHLREADLSAAVAARAVAGLIGIDRDAESLAEVQRSYGHLGVETVGQTVRGLIKGRHVHQRFDLIYASGLYDYLAFKIARVLTGALFQMLTTGGRLLIGNFVPEMPGTGYMEAVLDWHLIYRREFDMLELATHVDRSCLLSARTFRDPHGNIVFLELVRR
jgi:protein-L-isoaspartate O-methyltransferase